VLLCNQKSRGFNEQLLIIVIFHWRLLIEFDHCRLLCDGDFRAGYFRQVLAHFPEIVVRSWSRKASPVTTIPAASAVWAATGRRINNTRTSVTTAISQR
jgi:hypothetical protein